MTYPSNQSHSDGDKVNIRWLDIEKIDAAHWPLLDSLLNDEERARADRFHFGHDRRSFVAGHALMRTMLSDKAPLPPTDWRFVENPQGKPEAVMPPGHVQLRANLSHTRGLAAVALTINHDVGIDVEWRARDSLTLDLADHFFAPAEIAALHAMPAGQVNEGLFAFWTLKESLIKAVGLGLSMPLESFAFTLEPLAVRFEPGHEKPGPWLFRRFFPTPGHAMALSLRHPSPARVVVDAQPASATDLIARFL